MKQRWLALKKSAWDDRLPRERQAIGAAALVLAPALMYWLLWQPAHSATAKLRTALPLMRAQAAQMKRDAEEVELLRQRPQPAVMDAFALKTVLETSAAHYQLREAMERVDPLEPNSARITFPSVPYAQWLRWIRALQQEQHVRIDSLDITALPSAGMAKINVTLTNGASR